MTIILRQTSIKLLIFVCFQQDTSDDILDGLNKIHEINSQHFEYFTSHFTKKLNFHKRISSLIDFIENRLVPKTKIDYLEMFQKWKKSTNRVSKTKTNEM